MFIRMFPVLYVFYSEWINIDDVIHIDMWLCLVVFWYCHLLELEVYDLKAITNFSTISDCSWEKCIIERGTKCGTCALNLRERKTVVTAPVMLNLGDKCLESGQASSCGRFTHFTRWPGIFRWDIPVWTVVTAPVMLNLGDKCRRVVKLQATAALRTVHIERDSSVEISPLCSMISNI